MTVQEFLALPNQATFFVVSEEGGGISIMPGYKTGTRTYRLLLQAMLESRGEYVFGDDVAADTPMLLFLTIRDALVEVLRQLDAGDSIDVREGWRVQ
ncbi:MAG: hypothetical protein WCW16_01475 [Candidatus Magasanikbacteria bacterium]